MNHQATPAVTILVVDNDHANLKILVDYLEESGFDTLIATDGKKAIRQANRFPPDLILLDVMMPGLDGFETCRRLKANKSTRNIPVIFMTALSDIDSKVKGFEAGAVDFVTKPSEHRELLARVTTHIAIRSLQQSLRKQVAELDAFAHTVAHDLQNPLARLIGFAELLAENSTTIPAEKLQEYLRIIARDGRKMNNIIKALLLLAHVRQRDIKPAPLDMAGIVAEAQQRLVDMIEANRPQIVLVDPPAWPVAMGYAPWVEEVWVNYLSNALKYGGQPPYIELGAEVPLCGEEAKEGQVRFWVSDNGPGLTPEEQARLFTPFTRLDQVCVEGHGLGLSIVCRIVEKLGGQVGIESEVGQGSKFSFTLPGVVKRP